MLQYDPYRKLTVKNGSTTFSMDKSRSIDEGVVAAKLGCSGMKAKAQLL
jgi:hypothetical protein